MIADGRFGIPAPTACPGGVMQHSFVNHHFRCQREAVESHVDKRWPFARFDLALCARFQPGRGQGPNSASGRGTRTRSRKRPRDSGGAPLPPPTRWADSARHHSAPDLHAGCPGLGPIPPSPLFFADRPPCRVLAHRAAAGFSFSTRSARNSPGDSARGGGYGAALARGTDRYDLPGGLSQY